jgi:hypothetical protein
MPIETYDRLSLAQEQLETALHLLLDLKSYSSAITLAGAAEEIFGKAITATGGKPALEYSYDSISEFHPAVHKSPLDKRQYIAEENTARNALKHLQAKDGPTVTLDLEVAACWMLVRALKNGQALGLEFDRYQEFDSWFYELIVGAQHE